MKDGSKHGTGFALLGIVTSPANPPDAVIRPILLVPSSLNHNAPSGPAVIPPGQLPGVGSGNSSIASADAGTASTATRPTRIPSSDLPGRLFVRAGIASLPLPAVPGPDTGRLLSVDSPPVGRVQNAPVALPSLTTIGCPMQ